MIIWHLIYIKRLQVYHIKTITFNAIKQSDKVVTKPQSNINFVIIQKVANTIATITKSSILRGLLVFEVRLTI